MRAGTRSREAVEREADAYADHVLDSCRWWERMNLTWSALTESPVVIDGTVGGRRLGQSPGVVAEDVLDWEPVAMANLIEAAQRPAVAKRGLEESERQAIRGMNSSGWELREVARIRLLRGRQAQTRRKAEEKERTYLQDRIRHDEQRLEELDREQLRLNAHLAGQERQRLRVTARLAEHRKMARRESLG